MTEPLLLTIQGTADALSCSTRLVEKLIAGGELRSLRIGKRARRVSREAVIAYIVRVAGDQDVDPLADGLDRVHAQKRTTVGGPTDGRAKEVRAHARGGVAASGAP